jgi:hypothetical protein
MTGVFASRPLLVDVCGTWVAVGASSMLCGTHFVCVRCCGVLVISAAEQLGRCLKRKGVGSEGRFRLTKTSVGVWHWWDVCNRLAGNTGTACSAQAAAAQQGLRKYCSSPAAVIGHGGALSSGRGGGVGASGYSVLQQHKSVLSSRREQPCMDRCQQSWWLQSH